MHTLFLISRISFFFLASVASSADQLRMAHPMP
jgi:hypothetical protein